jgi:hypothetical protein
MELRLLLPVGLAVYHVPVALVFVHAVNSLWFLRRTYNVLSNGNAISRTEFSFPKSLLHRPKMAGIGSLIENNNKTKWPTCVYAMYGRSARNSVQRATLDGGTASALIVVA